jgi:hypothetical protein
MPKPARKKSVTARSFAAPEVPSRARAKKVSLTVDENVLRAMKHEAKRTGRTLSAEVSDALARELRRRRLHDLVAEHEAEHGLISAEELAEIQTEWQG